MEADDSAVIQLLSERNESAFEQVFKANFKRLHAYAFTILKDEIIAEEMVQNVFFKIWEKTGQLAISGSIAAYLYRSVHNECLNYLKHQKVRSSHQLYLSRQTKQHSDNASHKAVFSELTNKLNQALSELPEQCRTIFQMSRFEELKYREIADQLGISIKTVENQMGKALKILRVKLIDFLPLIVFSFSNL